jgi:hypothetical protein
MFKIKIQWRRTGKCLQDGRGKCGQHLHLKLRIQEPAQLLRSSHQHSKEKRDQNDPKMKQEKKSTHGSNDVGSQNTISLGIGDDLHEPLGVCVRAGPAVGGKREISHVVLSPSLFELVLSLSNPSDLRVRVNDGGDSVVVNMTMASSNLFRDGNALLLGLVSKHGTNHDITNRENVLLVGPELLVNLDTTPFVNVNANFLKDGSDEPS